MNTPSINRSKHHRFPGEAISQAVWLYCRCCLRDRDVEARLLARGSIVTDEALRQWGRPFGRQDADPLRRRPRPGDTWHLEAVLLTLPGTRPDLWRAGAQDGHVRALLGPRRRHPKAAKTFCRERLPGWTDVPRGRITDQLNREGAAQPERRPGVEHRPPRDLNKRAEHAHPPPRQRAWRRPGGQAPGHAQRFLAASGPLAPPVRPRRHRDAAPAHRQERRQRFETWQDITRVPTAASGHDSGGRAPSCQ